MPSETHGPDAQATGHEEIDAPAGPRWYPVIDYERCRNCKQCVDFCLFGVYVVDEAGTARVRQPDNCKDGCPACSRVCPTSAIMFPHYEDEAIAGGGGLVGQPDGPGVAKPADPRAATGRQAAGAAPHDELDDLIDELDKLDDS